MQQSNVKPIDGFTQGVKVSLSQHVSSLSNSWIPWEWYVAPTYNQIDAKISTPFLYSTTTPDLILYVPLAVDSTIKYANFQLETVQKLLCLAAVFLAIPTFISMIFVYRYDNFLFETELLASFYTVNEDKFFKSPHQNPKEIIGDLLANRTNYKYKYHQYCAAKWAFCCKDRCKKNIERRELHNLSVKRLRKDLDIVGFIQN